MGDPFDNAYKEIVGEVYNPTTGEMETYNHWARVPCVDKGYDIVVDKSGNVHHIKSRYDKKYRY